MTEVMPQPVAENSCVKAHMSLAVRLPGSRHPCGLRLAAGGYITTYMC